ncbi:hypothetical protein ACFQ6E_39520 [Streptomyces sp. NPDC056462]|uniref:hypothetical protein n=1 Tax=Streptomyces sp. NPDC056462 TaxID=3345826 RepID=UPI0036B57E02
MRTLSWAGDSIQGSCSSAFGADSRASAVLTSWACRNIGWVPLTRSTVLGLASRCGAWQRRSGDHLPAVRHGEDLEYAREHDEPLVALDG